MPKKVAKSGSVVAVVAVPAEATAMPEALVLRVVLLVVG
jgi:hypothetical protein